MAASNQPKKLKTQAGEKHQVCFSEITEFIKRKTSPFKVVSKSPQDNCNKYATIEMTQNSSKVRMKLFDEAINYYNSLEIDSSYTLKNMKLQMTNTDFEDNEHEYEIVADKDTKIEKVDADSIDTIVQKTKFTKLSELISLEHEAMINVIIIVISVDASDTKNKITGESVQKKILRVKDENGTECELLYWNEDFDEKFQIGHKYKILNAIINHYEGKVSLKLSKCKSKVFPKDIVLGKKKKINKSNLNLTKTTKPNTCIGQQSLVLRTESSQQDEPAIIEKENNEKTVKELLEKTIWTIQNINCNNLTLEIKNVTQS